MFPIFALFSGCFSLGYYDHDDNEETHENIESAVDCHKKCLDESDCHGFVYREGFSVEEQEKRCEVKDEFKDDKFQPWYGFVHGLKNCGKACLKIFEIF